MSHLITCRAIAKSFGARPLFEDLSFTLNEGDRVGVIGPNGSGKSTWLRILAGLEFPDAGELVSRRDLRISYLTQADRLDAAKTIEEVLHDALRHCGVPEPEWAVRAADVIGIFGGTSLSTPVSKLSGGWRKRLSIASQLVQEPQLLLLDEPTNHLDIEGIQWLEKYLPTARFAFVLVSHDRVFLENVTNRMVEVNRRFPTGFFAVDGSYSRFLEKREEYLTAIQRHEDALASRVRREVEWLSRGPKARGTKAAARIQEAHRLIGELNAYKTRSRQQDASEIEFSASGRRTKRLVVAEGISMQFGDRPLFRDLSFVLSPGMRIGLLGNNGSGKSTLLNILAGKLDPVEGSIEYAPQLRIVTFDQGRELLHKDWTLARTLSPDGDGVVFQGRAMHVASYAARFLFRGDALHQSVGTLSGGEQARVLIAQLMLQPADVLLLDEPTNDLDIDTLEVLEESLEEFPGAVVLVTHDRLMLDRISQVLVGLEGDGSGDCSFYAECSQWLSRPREVKRERGEASGKPRSSAPTKPKRLSYLEKREWEQIEERIEEAEERLAQCRSAVSDPAIASDAVALSEAVTALDRAQEEVDRLYTRWAELEEKQR